MAKTYILRLGHRAVRDKRVSTHVALVARALGADGVYYTGDLDDSFEESVEKVVNQWGGPFKIEHLSSWRQFIKHWPGQKIHLTMYGLPFQDHLESFDNSQDTLIIVGGQKVPAEVYQLVDFNIGVTAQPHSEIAALAVFLDHYFDHKTLSKEFKNAKKKVIPKERGKEVLDL